MANSRDGAAVRSAVSAADEHERAESPSDELTLSNGLRLRVRAVPLLLLRRVGAKLPPPQPPKIYLEDKGREEENPNDPEYLARMQQYGQDVFDASINIFLLLGTELLEVPDGLDGPEGEGWLETLRLLDIDVDVSSPKARYLSWMQNHALVNEQDLVAVATAVMTQSGITEQEVATAAESFRRRTARGADNSVPD